MQCLVALLVCAAVVCSGNCKIPSKQILNELFRKVDFKHQAVMLINVWMTGWRQLLLMKFA